MDWSAIHNGFSGCRVNLNLTRLLKEGKITQSEFERLITFSKVGLESIICNIVFALIFTWICFDILPGAFEIPGASALFGMLFISIGLLCPQLCHPKWGFIRGILMFIGLLLVKLLV